MADAIRFLKIGEVVRRASISERSIYSLIADGGFPRPAQLTSRRVGWVEAEVDAWLTAKIEARDAVS